MKSTDNPESRRHEIVIQEADSEILIYDLAINKAFCLNETSAIIWQECDGNKSVAEISRIISQKQKTNVSEDIVWLAVQQFKKDGLLDKSSEFITPLDGLTRREIVKKIGFASIIALPIITSVVAPSAVHAQSGGCSGFNVFICVPGNNNMLNAAGCPCTGNVDCQSVCLTGTMLCAGGPPSDPICAPGNDSRLSAPCCACTGNLECQTVCLTQTMLCAG